MTTSTPLLPSLSSQNVQILADVGNACSQCFNRLPKVSIVFTFPKFRQIDMQVFAKRANTKSIPQVEPLYISISADNAKRNLVD